MASIFSTVYFLAPLYMISVLVYFFVASSWQSALLYASPMIISTILPPLSGPGIWTLTKPILLYFDYEEIHETSPVNAWDLCIKEGKTFLFVLQPHGVISFGGICSAANAPPEVNGQLKTAVADALLHTPILKHVMGIFGLVSASKKNMIQYMKQPGVQGSLVLYVGGMAELFLSSETRERLYLKKRKGFIKLALQQGVDVVPVYLFGNTNVLSVWKNPVLMGLSRKLQVSLTYVWGKWGLPIPRDCKILYVSGQPLGMPQIVEPTQEDIDKWHAKYCEQVTRLFEKYKEKVPEYKHKKLEIV